MKKVAFAVASALTLVAPMAFGQDRYYDDRRFDDRRDSFARVIESRPVYDAANAKSECLNTRTGAYEEVREENKHRIGKGAAIGAVAGGVLGHQVDQGGGTAAGAVLGGLLGHFIEGRRDRDDQADLDMSRCRTLADNGALQGYDVRYEYRGQEYVTRMSHEPGRRLRVGEDIDYDGSPRDGQVAYTWR